MDRMNIERAAAILAEARQSATRLDVLPPQCRPSAASDGYAIQRALHEALGIPVAGYKIGCTTAVMQKFLGIAQPCGGSIQTTDIHSSPARLPHGAFRRVGVECEIAVRLAHDLPPEGAPYDRHTVAAAVGACMAAIEIVDDRYEDYTALDAATLIADDFFGAGCVLGPARADWRSLDLAVIGAAMRVNGIEVGSGTGAQVMGHPFEALAWLANTMADQGRFLTQGQIVMTGSIVETQWVAAGDIVTVSIAGLGEAEVGFV